MANNSSFYPCFNKKEKNKQNLSIPDHINENEAGGVNESERI